MWVHLPGKQYVQFDTSKTIDQLQQTIQNAKKTHLTEFFANNTKELENPLSNDKLGYDAEGNVLPTGPQLLYHEYPRYYRWENKKWIRRSDTTQWQIGRMHTATPKQGQRWYLRLLLNHVRGPTSFLDLLTYQGKQYNCFKKRCIAEKLLETDDEWDAVLKEATTFASASQLRRLFMNLVKECNPNEPCVLWHKYKDDMIDDYIYQYKQQIHCLKHDISKDIIEKMYNSALYEICNLLEQYGITLSDVDLLKPKKQECWRHEPLEIMHEKAYNTTQCEIDYKNKYKSMNEQQKLIFDNIKDTLYDDNIIQSIKKHMFFIDAPGGTVRNNTTFTL